MDHQGHHSSSSGGGSQQQRQRRYSNEERQGSSEAGTTGSTSSSSGHQMPYMRNNDYRKFLQMAAHQEPITFKDLAAVRSFKMTNEREYDMTVLLAHTLNEEMTKYRLAKTPPELLDELATTFAGRALEQLQSGSV